ncbi:MAG: hypothetical protein IIB27_00970 [Chloroflexi bacterium]|nr:hypothetical protein [Chloroflexota bacterium]
MAFTTTCPYCKMPSLETGFALADGYSRCHLCGWTEMFRDDSDERDDDSGRTAVLQSDDDTGSSGIAIRTR